MQLVSYNFDTIKKGFRSFDDKNLGSVGQRALKLMAVKFGVLKKKSAPSAIQAKIVCKHDRPGVELFSKFEGK